MLKRKTEIFTIILFLAVIFVFAGSFLVLPDTEFSQDENRVLQGFPKFSAERLIDGTFNSEIGKYYADQFPARNLFVGAKTGFSFALALNQNKGAVIANDGYLIQRYDIYDDVEHDFDLDLTFTETMHNISANAGYIGDFAGALDPSVSFCFAVPPRKVDVMANKLPLLFPTDRNDIFYKILYDNLGDVAIPELLKNLKSKNDEYIYYKTDHHWTTLGAFYAYEEICRFMGIAAFPKEYFTFAEVSDSFFGTTWSKAGAKWIAPDIMEYARFEGDESFTTAIEGGKSFSSFYDTEQLAVKDKYSSFIGGINARTTVTSGAADAAGREKLLLIADSFGQSIAPFLAAHFDLEIVDLRFYDGYIYDFIEENGIKKVILMQNMESLSTQRNLIKLTPME